MATADLIKAAESAIGEELDWLIGKLKELANGIYMVKYTPEGDERVYFTAPDRVAIMYLMDRVMGKPVNKTESKNEHTLTVRLAMGKRDRERDAAMGIHHDPDTDHDPDPLGDDGLRSPHDTTQDRIVDAVFRELPAPGIATHSPKLIPKIKVVPPRKEPVTTDSLKSSQKRSKTTKVEVSKDSGRVARKVEPIF